jgi:hypothetical protein
MNSIDTLVQNIHKSNCDTNCKIVMAVTGGGFSSFNYLMSQPGASNTVLEIIGPYMREAIDDFTKIEIKSYTSIETTYQMAYTALNRAKELTVMSQTNLNDLGLINKCIGVGVTSALRSSTWKRGDHRCYITILTSNLKHSFYLNLFKGTEESPYRSRNDEDIVCGSLIIQAIAISLGILDIKDIIFDEEDIFTYNIEILEDPLDALINNESVKSILYLPSGEMLTNVPIHKLKNKVHMVPGSFNPLHSGHKLLLEQGCSHDTEQKYSQGVYELCISNVDKDTLDKTEIVRRLEQFKSPNKYPVVLTNTPKFFQKAELFPGVNYSIGIDTALRLVDPYYSDNDEELMIKNLLKMIFSGTQFYVGSRTLEICNLPERYKIEIDKTELLSLSLISTYLHPLIKDSFKEITDSSMKDISSSLIRNS